VDFVLFCEHEVDWAASPAVERVVVVEYDCERWIWTASPAGLVVE
jgi:hypothetical protein